MYVAREEEVPWEQWSISSLRSSLDLDLLTSPTLPTQLRRTKTANIGSKYTPMHSSHFIRGARIEVAWTRTFITRRATPPPPRHRPPRIQRRPHHHPHQSPPGHPIPEEGRTAVPLITNANGLPFGSRSKWMWSGPGDDC